MSSKESKNPDVGCSSRDVSISRRGGVRTRGGRLPPISMRDINQMIGTKKVLAPNIPRRRAIVKNEESQGTCMEAQKVKVEPGTDSPRPRRSRPAKVILQTGGTFLAEGPAARIKKDTVGLDLSFSLPRVSARKGESERKYDSETIKDVLSSYDAKSFYEDYFSDFPPNRFPSLKQKSIIKIKSEPEDDDSTKVKIKSEVKEDETIITPPKSVSKKAVDYFRDIKNDGMLILLKLPTCLPFMKQAEGTGSDDKVKKDSKHVKEEVVGKEIQEEGLIGKMRFMRSGRMKLVFGKVELELTDDSPSESYMEAAAITVQENTADLMNELTAEGKNAIDSPGSPAPPDFLPQDYILDEYEERSMIEPASYDDPKLKELINVLIEWINDELAGHRIIVKDIEEDLYDGQVLQKLLEKLMDVKLDVVEVTQSEEGQKIKLKRVLEAANNVLGVNSWNQAKWNVESIHSKNVVAILHLLVSLARHFRAPIRLPENIVVNVVVVQKRDGMLHTRTVAEELTSTYDDLGLRFERDAFDTLFDHAPDKLQVVKKSLMTFVNTHLNKINLEVTDLDTQFHDGLYLTLLMGLLEGYFVPLYSFNLTPTTFDQKVHNVTFAFELMMDAGLPKPKARPEDIVNIDLKSTLRVLYNLFSKYKHLN